jgi:hypothetical protein
VTFDARISPDPSGLAQNTVEDGIILNLLGTPRPGQIQIQILDLTARPSIVSASLTDRNPVFDQRSIPRQVALYFHADLQRRLDYPVVLFRENPPIQAIDIFGEDCVSIGNQPDPQPVFRLISHEKEISAPGKAPGRRKVRTSQSFAQSQVHKRTGEEEERKRRGRGEGRRAWGEEMRGEGR